jgi:hypothetical protein
MPIRLHIAIGAVFAVIVGGLLYAFFHAPRRGELFDKPGWSVLQGMNDPALPQSRVILVRRDEFDVVGFRGIGQPTVRIYGAQPHWTWVLLNEHQADGDIKQMPEFGSYDLPCSDLGRIERATRNVDGYVMKYLRSICH